MKVQFNQEIRDKLLIGIGKNRKYLLDEELFKTLYVKEGYSLSQMSILTGLSNTVLQSYKKKLGLPNHTQQTKVADIITKEVAIKEYVEGGLTISDMAKKYNLSYASISNRLKDLGVYEPRKNYDRASATKYYRSLSNTGVVARKEDQSDKIDFRGGIKCPVCGKEFYPAPYHQWKSSRGTRVCSYSCSLKSGAKYWGVNSERYVTTESEDK